MRPFCLAILQIASCNTSRQCYCRSPVAWRAPCGSRTRPRSSPGGANGMGRATALAFAREGADSCCRRCRRRCWRTLVRGGRGTGRAGHLPALRRVARGRRQRARCRAEERLRPPRHDLQQCRNRAACDAVDRGHGGAVRPGHRHQPQGRLLRLQARHSGTCCRAGGGTIVNNSSVSAFANVGGQSVLCRVQGRDHVDDASARHRVCPAQHPRERDQSRRDRYRHEPPQPGPRRRPRTRSSSAGEPSRRWGGWEQARKSPKRFCSSRRPNPPSSQVSDLLVDGGRVAT